MPDTSSSPSRQQGVNVVVESLLRINNYVNQYYGKLFDKGPNPDNLGWLLVYTENRINLQRVYNLKISKGYFLKVFCLRKTAGFAKTIFS